MKKKINQGKRIEKKIENKCKKWDRKDCGASGGIYCLGFIGALIYYILTATGFWNGVLGVLKALVWPAFLVFELMKFLSM